MFEDWLEIQHYKHLLDNLYIWVSKNLYHSEKVSQSFIRYGPADRNDHNSYAIFPNKAVSLVQHAAIPRVLPNYHLRVIKTNLSRRQNMCFFETCGCRYLQVIPNPIGPLDHIGPQQLVPFGMNHRPFLNFRSTTNFATDAMQTGNHGPFSSTSSCRFTSIYPGKIMFQAGIHMFSMVWKVKS